MQLKYPSFMKNIFYLLLVVLNFSCKIDKSKEIHNTQNIIKANQVNGKYQGKYLELDSKGNKLKEGYMIDGLKRGIWKDYQDNNLIRVQKFMNDSLEYELDKNDYIYEEVYLEGIDSYVPIPKSWDTNLVFKNKKLLLTSVKDCNNVKEYCPNIVFNYENLDGASFKNFVLNDRRQIHENIEGLKEIEFDKNIGKYESYQLRYIKQTKGIEITGLCIWINLDNKVVIFRGSTEKNDINKFLLLFIEIGNSLTKNKN